MNGFSGAVNLTSGAVSVRSGNALGSGPVNLANGASYYLATSATTTFANPITLNGIGGMVDGYAKPAIYGERQRRRYTLSGRSRWRPAATWATTKTMAC